MKLSNDVKSLYKLAKEFNGKGKVLKEAKKQMLRDIGQEMVNDLQMTLPNKTGKLRGSVKMKLEKGQVVSVFTASKYAEFLEHGTKTHMVKPTSKTALSWDNKTKFSKGHKVRGIKAGNYFHNTFERTQKGIMKHGFKLLEKTISTK